MKYQPLILAATMTLSCVTQAEVLPVLVTTLADPDPIRVTVADIDQTLVTTTEMTTTAAPTTLVANGKVPVYRNNTLAIPEVLVVTADGTTYYRNIEFTTNPDGSFKLMQAQRNNLAYVDTIEVKIAQYAPLKLQVKVQGNLPSPCSKLDIPVVRYDGVFNVILPVQVLHTDFDSCVAMLAPFTTTVEIDVTDVTLAHGEYAVKVNEQQAKFVLGAAPQ
jgi:hypothetical protein